MKSAKLNTTLLKVADLHEMEDNPNEQTAKTFQQLMEEIDTEGFDEPPVVVSRSEGGYTVVSGNHRLRALRKLGYEDVDCIVKDWDAEKCKLKVVRRNMMKGDLNPAKFTMLVDSLSGYTHEELQDAMGFRDMDQYALYYQTREPDVPHGAGGKVEGLIDGLGLILNQLFTEYGDTVPHGFMYFLYGGEIHLVIQMDDDLKEAFKEITDECVESESDLCATLTERIKK